MSAHQTSDSTQDAHQTREYWNNVARRMKQRQQATMLTGDDSPFLHRKRAVTLTKFIARIPAQGKKVLEIGCGQGGNLQKIAEAQPAKIVGCDISEAMLEVARQNTSQIAGVELVQIDGLTLPFQGRSFDIAFTTTVLQHNPDSVVTQLLAEICRVTGDRLYLFEDTGASKQARFSFVLRPVSEYAALCAAQGFELIETEPLGLYVSESAYRALRLIFGRRPKEGIPISRAHAFLEQAALPLTGVLDKRVKQRRGLVKMVFQRRG
jgi:ubiquinone/menaquinone biosynthesis C-methylase UbiE